MSVIVTVFNEQKAVAKKIDNFLTNGYPGNSEMIVVSDGSTDNTVEIISQFEGPRIRLIENRTRRGKDPTLEDAVRDSTGEILLFTDVGAIFADDALEKLVRPFSDPNLGLVTGVARYLGAESAGLYRRHEDWLKSLEARVGVLSGALGPMFAIRRSSWRRKELALFNDFTDPIVVALEGKSATVATEAVCYQNRAGDGHWARQVRNVACAAPVLSHYLPKLIAAWRWNAVFVLVSHKLLRWLTLPLLAVMTVASWRLRDAGRAYALTLALEAAFLMIALAGLFADKAGFGRRLRVAYDFLVMSLAWSVGLVRWMTGRVPVVWQPRGL
ncbi:MAG: glycosyltransferase [Candidatus Binataceae bacterium]